MIQETKSLGIDMELTAILGLDSRTVSFGIQMFVLIIIVFIVRKVSLFFSPLYAKMILQRQAPGLNGSSELCSQEKKSRSSSNFVPLQDTARFYSSHMNNHDPVSRSRRWHTLVAQTLLMGMPWSLDGQPSNHRRQRQLPEEASQHR